jgi:hypothetical protein
MSYINSTPIGNIFQIYRYQYDLSKPAFSDFPSLTVTLDAFGNNKKSAPELLPGRTEVLQRETVCRQA